MPLPRSELAFPIFCFLLLAFVFSYIFFLFIFFSSKYFPSLPRSLLIFSSSFFLTSLISALFLSRHLNIVQHSLFHISLILFTRMELTLACMYAFCISCEEGLDFRKGKLSQVKRKEIDAGKDEEGRGKKKVRVRRELAAAV